MYALISLALTLTGLTTAAPSLIPRQGSDSAEIYPYANNTKINRWAVVNAHVAAGTNLIEVQRPTVYQSDPAHLYGTPEQFTSHSAQLIWDLKGSEYPYSATLPDVASGDAGRVSASIGLGGSEAWYVEDGKLLAKDGDLFLCVQELPGQGATGYLLYYGKDFTPGDRPELSCDSVDLLV